jgi:multicomponent Na+:H+ antiporter subunit C
MPTLLILLVGVLTTAGVYLMLRRNLLRMVFGLVLLSNAVNILILTVGRADRLPPPLVGEGASALVEPYANPLPQALVLTAIVIGFGLVSFALVLVYRNYLTTGSLNAESLELGAVADEPASADRGVKREGETSNQAQASR